MDEWDLDPPPQPTTRVPGPRSDEAPAATPGSAAGPGRDESAPAPLPEEAVTLANGASADGSSKADDQTARPSRRRRRMTTLAPWVAAALVLLAVGAVIGLAVARAQNDDIAAELSRTRDELSVVERALSQAEERNWNYYRENLALKAQIEAMQGGGSSSTTTTTSGQGGSTVYGDGIYMVGEDIAAGIYDGVVVGEQGYWARLKATDGQVSSIIANAILREAFVLTIVVSDRAVELRGVRITAR